MIRPIVVQSDFKEFKEPSHPTRPRRSGRAPEYLRLNPKVVDLVKYFVE